MRLFAVARKPSGGSTSHGRSSNAIHPSHSSPGAHPALAREPPLPLARVGPAGRGRGAVAGAPDRVPAGALVADGALDIGVDDVLARRSPVAGRPPAPAGGVRPPPPPHR